MKVRYRSELTGNREYDIPDIWVAGFTTGGRTIMEAVSWWAYQEYLKENEDPYPKEHTV